MTSDSSEIIFLLEEAQKRLDELEAKQQAKEIKVDELVHVVTQAVRTYFEHKNGAAGTADGSDTTSATIQVPESSPKGMEIAKQIFAGALTKHGYGHRSPTGRLIITTEELTEYIQKVVEYEGVVNLKQMIDDLKAGSSFYKRIRIIARKLGYYIYRIGKEVFVSKEVLKGRDLLSQSDKKIYDFAKAQIDATGKCFMSDLCKYSGGEMKNFYRRARRVANIVDWRISKEFRAKSRRIESYIHYPDKPTLPALPKQPVHPVFKPYVPKEPKKKFVAPLGRRHFSEYEIAEAVIQALGKDKKASYSEIMIELGTKSSQVHSKIKKIVKKRFPDHRTKKIGKSLYVVHKNATELDLLVGVAERVRQVIERNFRERHAVTLSDILGEAKMSRSGDKYNLVKRVAELMGLKLYLRGRVWIVSKPEDPIIPIFDKETVIRMFDEYTGFDRVTVKTYTGKDGMHPNYWQAGKFMKWICENIEYLRRLTGKNIKITGKHGDDCGVEVK